jgi:hypothetical protein
MDDGVLGHVRNRRRMAETRGGFVYESLMPLAHTNKPLVWLLD